jgi:hypothetical protein
MSFHQAWNKFAEQHEIDPLDRSASVLALRSAFSAGWQWATEQAHADAKAKA